MTKVIFIQLKSNDISQLGLLCSDQHTPIPLFCSTVPAGFPSPAEGWVERTLDLNDLCIRNPNSSYFVRVKGDSMINAGISDGDVLVIDRAVAAHHNSIVVARVGAELTVKRLETRPVRRLVPDNPAYQPINTDGLDVEIIGVATFTIKKLSI